MLLNNMCESINAVLRPCRDKVVLTHMEWIRRFIMRRHHKKKEGLNLLNGGILPYVKKQFEWAARHTKVVLLE